MTYDLIRNFESYFKTLDVVLGSYKLQDGYYYIIKKDNTYKKLIIDKGNESDYELSKYVIKRDFYSQCINADKAIYTRYKQEDGKNVMMKKIFSNNIYTLFFKNTSILELCNENSSDKAVPINIFKKGIEKYYESLSKLGDKKEEKILLDKFYEEKEIIENKKRMLDAFEVVVKDLENEKLPKETWIKIFLEEEIEEYERVGKIYLSLKLFNTNDSNIQINDEIYGVNNYNFGLNSKKPFLDLKSTPYKVSSLVSKQEIEILNNLYIWLYNNGISENVLKLPLDWNFNGIPKIKDHIYNKDIYLIKVKTKGKEKVARIDDFDYVSNYTTKIREFKCKDYIRKKGREYKTEKIYELEKYTNNIWFANNLECEKNYIKDSYYDYDEKISKTMLSNWKKDILRQNLDIFFDLFQKENMKRFNANLNKIAIEIIQNTLIEDLERNKKQLYNSINSLNLWIAYKCYFSKKGEDEEMKINNISEQCLNIFLNNGKIETDEQYYYLAGQVAFYLLNKSKADKLTQDVTVPFIKSANIKKLKSELEYLYEKYNYGTFLNDKKFNNILSQLSLNEPEKSVKELKHIILAGMLGENIFYNKKDLGGNQNGENE